jgi:hypothetical protein
VSAITVEIPSTSEQPFLFQRAFLGAIRKAIGEAQIAGKIDAATAVACNRALPPAATPDKAA